jgi:serine/threonine protein kinase
MKECPSCGKCLDDNELRCPHDGSTLNVSLDGSRLIDKKYLLIRCLGRGGMGSVYLAQHVELQKNFALKLIQHSALSYPVDLVRFRTEAKALGKLQHPNIVQVTDYGIDSRNSDIPYLVMEYLEGKTLLHHLREKSALDIEQAIPILESIASAIDYAHTCGVLHRDLNLKNVFLVQDSFDSMQVKILDFGLARIIGERSLKEEREIPKKSIRLTPHKQREKETQTLIIDNDSKDNSLQKDSPLSRSAEFQLEERDRLTQAGTVMGTPGYIAPEILQGRDATEASEIYSFGVLIFEILVGHSPYKDSVELQHIPDSPPIPSQEQAVIPRELDQAILAPLKKEPDMRPKKALDVVRRIQNAYFRYKCRLWRTKEVPKRSRMAGALTIVFILIFWLVQSLPVVKSIENFLVDFRFQLLPSQPPDERILLVSIDEATLQADPALLVEKAEEMGILLQSVMDAGARGVSIDFLLPERWNQSESFARLVLSNQGKLVLASYIKEDGSIMGMECIEGLIMVALGSAERAGALFGFLNIQPDFDGRLRRMQIGLQNQEGQKMYSMPARAFQILNGGDLSDEQIEQRLWVDYSIDWNKFQRISWKDLSSLIIQRQDFFYDKIVLVGGEYEGSQDFHRIPKKPGLDDEASGLVIQALTFNTLLQDKQIRDLSAFYVFLPMAAIFMFFSTIFLIRQKIFSFLITLFILLTGYILMAFFVFIWSRLLLPVGILLVPFLLTLVLVFLMRRKLNFVMKPSMEVK